jgi:hypothetical protein
LPKENCEMHLNNISRALSTQLQEKYFHYAESVGHSVFTATLSTFVTSKAVVAREFERFWNHDFMFRVLRVLPKPLRQRVDHDFVVEQSPEGHFHFHGLFAADRNANRWLWKDGQLNRQLEASVASLAHRGEYRAFSVPAYLIEPWRPADGWCTYICKDKNTLTI